MQKNSHCARRKYFYLLLYIGMQLFSACAPYKYPTKDYYKPPEHPLIENEYILYANYQEMASEHWLYHWIPRHRSQIRWYDLGHWCTWALFGNDDHGIFAESQLPLFKPCESITFHKALIWMIRNPLHNFCHYVIGSANRPNDEWTIFKINRKRWTCFHYEPVAHTVFAGRYNSFYLGFHGGKPLISLRLSYGTKWKSDFYIGWRERGNFGLKFLPLTKNSLVMWDDLQYEDDDGDPQW